jgi:drug/metabolite transporter (DMT)-like permease
MWQAALWTLVFSVATALSIALLGDKRLISGNLLSFRRFLELALGWQFIVAMALAFISRVTFILINNSLLTTEQFRDNATTITALVTAVSYLFVIAANYLLWAQRLSLFQGFGASLILAGVFLITWK